MDRAIGANASCGMDPYRTAMTDDHTRADLSIRMQINQGHDWKHLF
jgi:hypothetical protein